MGCGFILLGMGLLGLVTTLVFWIVFPNEFGTYIFLLIFGPISLLLVIIGAVIIARSRYKPNLIKEAIMNALKEQQINRLGDLIELKANSRSITDIDYLKHCTNLTILDLQHNLISDISPLSALANLKHLTLNNNRISDISPLVENSGIGEGDIINISNNKLDLAEGSEDMANIKALQNRGVIIIH